MPPSALSTFRGKSSQVVTLTVPALGIAVGKATGTFLYVITAPGAFSLKLDGESFVDVAEGSSLETVNEAVFEGFEVFNPGAAAITVKVYVGFARYNRNSVALLEQDSAAAGLGITSIAGTTAVVVAPTLSGLRIKRRSITVSNLDASRVVHIRDESGEVLGVIFAETAQVYFVSGTVEIFNPDAAAIDVFVGEVYYVRESA